VVGCWLEAGELDGVEEALSRMRVSLERSPPTNLAVATEAVLRAQLLARRGAVADAIAAAQSARVIHAPWWRAKASRLVGELAGDADALGEAERLEQALGLSAIRPRS
jgi:hypothetical protein